MGVYLRVDEHWEPDASRTLLYMKFDNNLNDDSGNNHTVTGAGIGYGTIGNNHYVEKTATTYSGTYINPSPASMNSVIGSGDFTVSLFFYNKTHTDNPMIFGNWRDARSPFHGIYILAASNETMVIYTTNNDFHSNPALSAPFEHWYHIVFTRINGVCYRYINGNLIDSFSNSVDFSTQVGDTFFLLNRSNASGHSWGNVVGGKISEVIFEKVGRSTDEVIDYFNYQKGNYGL